jgi:AcrR family transcriptional regulator
VLDAAVDSLLELGYTNTTAGVVADRARVSRGAMQYHFRTKSELMAAAVEHLVDRLSADMSAVADRLPPAVGGDRFSAAIDAWFADSSAPLFVAWLELNVAARTDTELDGLLRGVRGRLTAVVRQKSFELFGADPGDANAGMVIEMTLAMLSGLSVARYTGIGSGRRGRRQREVVAAWKAAAPVLLAAAGTVASS